jgi:hypothetical protein
MKKSAIVVIVCLSLFLVPASAQETDGEAFVLFAHGVADAPAVDVFIDGELGWSAWMYGQVSGFSSWSEGGSVTIEAGPHTITFAMAGEGLETALIDPLEVELDAGHQYLVAMFGLLEDETLQAKVYDLTEASNGEKASETISTGYILNLLEGPEAIDISIDGEMVIEQLAYGELGNYLLPLQKFHEQITVSGDPEQLIYETPRSFGEPYYASISAWFGVYPGEQWVDYSFILTDGYETDLITYLTNISEMAIEDYYTFNTFLEVVESAGLTETIRSLEGSFGFVVPTDEAFAASSEETEALLADADALHDFVYYHIIDRTAQGDDFEGFGSSGEFVTLQGGTITLAVDEDYNYTWNGANELRYASLSNGIMLFVDAPLFPPAGE